MLTRVCSSRVKSQKTRFLGANEPCFMNHHYLYSHFFKMKKILKFLKT